jgi:hypothetical protein
MKISLNGLELSRQAEGDMTVGQVLSEIQDEIRAAGRVVTGIAVDGLTLPEGWQRRQRLAMTVANAEVLQLTIEEPAELRRQTLVYASQLIGQLVQRTKPLGTKFRVGDEVTANNELASFLDDLKLVLAGLDHSTRDFKDHASATTIRNRVVQSANQLLPSLDRLYKAQAGGDYIAVADELEYDLRDQISAWPELVMDARQLIIELPQAQ